LRCVSFHLALTFVLTAVAASQQTSQSSPETDKRDLAWLETVWNDAHERGDVEALESLWADDLEVIVPKMPVMTKSDVLAVARSGRMRFLHYASSDTHVRVYGNAAVVTGRLQRTRALNGRELSDDWRFTKIYIRQGGRWRVVLFHASDAAEPTG
jgi:hypothetical protein